MSSFLKINRLASLILFCGVLLSAQILQAAKTCHLIAIADTNDSQIGLSVRKDLTAFTNLFYGNVASEQLKVHEIQGREVTRDQILSTIRQVNRAMSPDDTIIVYYAGHGAFDPQGKGHYLDLSRGQVLRTELMDSMESSKQVRLRVLITDACSNYKKLHKAPTEMAPSYAVVKTSPAFTVLCWQSKGVVDISSSSTGEVAMGDNNGGFFTASLVNYLDRNNQKQIQWPTVVREVRQATAAMFREKLPRGQRGPDGKIQRTQTVFARIADPSVDSGGGTMQPDFPSLKPDQGWRFGVRVRDQGGRGVVVTEVVAGNPGDRVNIRDIGRVSLEPGDRIVSINGRRIESEDDYSTAVQNSQQNMQLQVVNKRDGLTYDATVRLNY